jgi:hypothetical protein
MKRFGKTILALGPLISAVSADTLVVLPGDSINEKIAAAADGDIIAIFGGNYAQDVLANKSATKKKSGSKSTPLSPPLRALQRLTQAPTQKANS